MFGFQIISLPIVREGSRRLKGNGGQYGEAHHNLPAPDPITGLRLPLGNGCHDHTNCFECTEPPNKCKYGNKRRSKDNGGMD